MVRLIWAVSILWPAFDPIVTAAQCADAECTIDGVCRVNGSLDPTSPCRYCDSAQSQTAWSNVPRFTHCDDGRACTAQETCDGAGACEGVPLDCEDGDPCTLDACEESVPGCVSTQAPPGAACNDGDFCTLDETCDADGRCTGEGRSCADTLSCTSDLCNEDLDRCDHVPMLSCVINQQCITDGQANPDDNCQLCNAEQSTTAWSPRITLECLAMKPHEDPDEDGVESAAECPLGLAMCPDSDEDGLLDYLDLDDDGDRIGTRYEHADGAPFDHDRDGIPDMRDPDDDADGVLTRDEAPDPNGDSDPSDARDTDGDRTPDYLDPDDDGDGLPTRQELETATRLGEDSDGDGLPGYRDTDSDGDGVPDGMEGAIDSDGDGLPDYLQPEGADAGAGGAAAGSGGAGNAGSNAAEGGAGGNADTRDTDASNDETSSNPATNPSAEGLEIASGACSALTLGAPARGAAWWLLLAIAASTRRRRRG